MESLDKKVKVSKEEKNILKKISVGKINDNFFILNNLETAEQVLDQLSDLLCKIGLDENDEPNEIGYIIEDLIDKINTIET